MNNPRKRRFSQVGFATALLATATIVAAAAFAMTSHPLRSCVALSSGLILLAVVRALYPGRLWFASRSRAADVTVFMTVGIAALVLAPLVAGG